jgi:hypothetical protein
LGFAPHSISFTLSGVGIATMILPRSPDPVMVSKLIPWIAGPIFFGLLALILGQDANWDLRNYHLYNPFAWLHGRIDHDMVPAQVANFYNPLLHIPFYWAVMSLPPMLTGFLLGAVQGLNFPILVSITRCVMGQERERPQWHWYLAGLIGLLGAGTLAELGTTFGDNLISIPLLLSLWIILANYQRLQHDSSMQALLMVVGAGLLAGLAPGLKQPTAVFAVGWCAAFLVFPVSFGRRILLAFCFGVGVLMGIAITGGFWMQQLWVHYGNPLFPYFNDFFQSPMGAASHYRDTQFLPSSLWESVFLPILLIINPYRVGEIGFRDLRFILLIIAMVLSVIVFLRQSGKNEQGALTHQKGFFLLAAIVISYLVWLNLFAIYRYLLPLEMLAPLAIWFLVDFFPLRIPSRPAILISFMILWAFTLKPGNWGRVPWGSDYFGIHPPKLSDPANTMVIMAGVEPYSYMIPFFPEPVRFIRIESYFTGPSQSPNGFDRRMRELISGHHGPLYVMYRANETRSSKTALRHFNLEISQEQCQQMNPDIENHTSIPFYFCAVSPVNALAAAPTRNERNIK